MTTKNSVPRVELGIFPTPVQAAPRLAEAIGLDRDDLWIKRDDLDGFGGGGNKTRKLEYTVAEALAAGADTLVTTGAPQSNHARLTAAAGAKVGMDAVLVLSGEPGASHSGNIALDTLFGACIHWAGSIPLADAADNVVDRLRRDGARPYLIPYGGSTPNSARRYQDAGIELLAQLPGTTISVVALGSGGTMAGLIAALGADRVLGVHTGAVDSPAETVARLASPIASHPVEHGQVRIRGDQVGAGYATLTDATVAAIELAARTEALLLDPIYTGRAMAGLIAAVKDGTITAGTATVFWHTGGLPGLFGHADAISRLERGTANAMKAEADVTPLTSHRI
jgi:D-cysteine desulfhydrase